jgi:hypothetical protein
MKPAFQRKRIWVDPPFQGRLLLRLAFYLIAYIVVSWHLGFLFEAARDLAAGQGVKTFAHLYVESLLRQVPQMYAFVLLAPALLYDLLKFSHRVAGPLFRCRKVMQEMATGAVVPEFKPRKHDLMGELFAAFNALIRMHNARAGSTESEAGKGPEEEGKPLAPSARRDASGERPKVSV